MVCLRLHTQKSVNVISASARKLIILSPLPLLSGLPHTDVEVIMSQTAQKPQFDNIQLDSNSDLRIFYIVSRFKPFLPNLSLIPILFLLTQKWFCATQRKSQSNRKTILQTKPWKCVYMKLRLLTLFAPGEPRICKYTYER